MWTLGTEGKINNFKMEGWERQEKGKCRNRDGSIQERKEEENDVERIIISKMK